MITPRKIEKTFHLTKLTLLEIAPLFPFLAGRTAMHCIEAGGNTGLWCEAFMEVYGENVARFDSYEPMPGNIAKFKSRVESVMKRHKDVVHLHENCVGPKAGPVEINFDHDVTTLASVVVKDFMIGGKKQTHDKHRTVQQVKLDEQIETLGLSKVDLVKIDVEGYEWNVLEGMTGSLSSGKIDNVYFEFGQHQAQVGQSFQQFYEFFKSRGFQIYRQTVGRNYFGLNEIRKYDAALEDKSSMWMILASRLGPSKAYNGPRVVGQFN